MKWLDRAVARPRISLTIALCLSAIGVLAWLTMPRMEDPTLPDRAGVILTIYPGADAETVERLVANPIEERLAEVDGIKRVFSTIRAEAVSVVVELLGTVSSQSEIDEAWNKVREQLADARREFPSGVGEPELSIGLLRTQAVVLAVQGSGDPRVLLRGAKRLKRALLSLRDVARVELTGDPEEQITVEYDDATARRVGIPPALLARQLQARNLSPPGGAIRVGSRRAIVRPMAEMVSLAELRRSPIVLPSGAALPLEQIARIRLGPAEPVSERMRYQGEPAIGVGAVPRESIDLVKFGEEVRARVAEVAPRLEPLRVSLVTYQPGRVEARLRDLGNSLLQGIAVVGGVLLLSMGLRLGLIVASVVPLVALASLGIYYLAGGILHQVSVAALVIALGMLVDNAIVMAELVQANLDRGLSKWKAARAAVSELTVPLFSATGTTVAAFVPMLLAPGNTGDFTRAIPLVIVLTLTMSYLFALLVTPATSALLLRRARRPRARVLHRIAGGLSTLSTRVPWLVLLVVLGGLVAVGFQAGSLKRQFFPSGDRNQLLVGIELPHGAHLDQTDAVATRLERTLLRRPEVASVATFLGRSAPRFYYNVPGRPQNPHLADLLVQTRSLEQVRGLRAWIRAWAARHLPEAFLVARTLEQGPPVGAPVEIRIYGDDLVLLEDAANRVLRLLRETPGARDVRHSLGLGMPTLRFAVEDAVAGRFGLSRSHVARALLTQTRGLPAGQYRAGREPVPIVVRGPDGELLPPGDLASLQVSGEPDPRRPRPPVPLSQVARITPEWRPAVLHHRNRRRLVTVSAQLEEGATYSSVLRSLEPHLRKLRLPAGLHWEFGGEAQSSGEANTALFRGMPLAVLLLLAFLLAEFNSFRRMAIILLTVPLAAIGVIPGLLLGDFPFGFTALLGVFALVGVVVNNAIVLLEVVERERSAGASIDAALGTATSERIRPILLTTATTVGGLAPLLFTSATLWPPLAAAMMAGLLASTLLTLIAVPALYRLLFRKESRRAPRSEAAT